MKAEELRRSVLQLAVEGKLVEQRPEEGTAKELLAEIAAERERLVREGKMKRSKPLAPVSPDEVPFEIPESWDWCWFTDVTRTVGGNNKILASEVQETGLYPAISQGKDYIDGYCDFSEKLVSDIPLVLFGDHTRNIKYIDFKFVISGDGVKLVKPLSFDEKYLYYWMVLTTKQLRDRGYARHFSLLKNQLFPLPPLAEQRRIVARLEELMPLIDAYDAEERRLSALETEFPEQLRRSLLQYVVEGKLVEQRPGEGTAKELLAEIAAERERLVRAGRMKRSKPLAPVSPDEVPFEIPESWEWVRLGEIVFVSTGKTPSTNETSYYTNGDIPWITSSYTDKDPISTVTSFITKKAVADVGLKIYSKGTLVYALYGQGKTRGQISELAIDATINQALAALEILHFSDSLKHYIKYFCKYNYNNIRTQSSGTSQPNLNLSKISNMLVPLPPLAEQRRIVARLEELMPLIDRIHTPVNVTAQKKK